MNDYIATVSDQGEFIINTDNKLVIDMYTIAARGIEEPSDSVYRRMVMREVETILTDIRKRPDQATRTIRTVFNGIVANRRKRMLWDLAWAISRVMTGAPPIVRLFFRDVYDELLCTFENHARLSDYVYTYCRTGERASVSRRNTEAKPASQDIGKLADSCTHQMQAHMLTLSKYQANIEREKSNIEEEYKRCIKQITEAAQAAIDDLTHQLEETTGQLNKAQDALSESKTALSKAKKSLAAQSSETHQAEIGEKYFVQLIDEYISPYEESDDSEERKKIYNELWNFVSSTSGVPKSILNRVKRLRMPLKKKPTQQQSVYIEKLYGTATGDAIQSFGNDEIDNLIEP